MENAPVRPVERGASGGVLLCPELADHGSATPSGEQAPDPPRTVLLFEEPSRVSQRPDGREPLSGRRPRLAAVAAPWTPGGD